MEREREREREKGERKNIQRGERAYYVPNGAALKKIVEIAELREAIKVKRFALARRFGSDSIAVRGVRSEAMVGITFEPNAVPANWCESKRVKGLYWPSKKTRECKAVQSEMDALRYPSFGIGSEYLDASSLHFPTVYKLCETWIVSQHRLAKPPEDCTPLKRSEYYALLEQAEARLKSDEAKVDR